MFTKDKKSEDECGEDTDKAVVPNIVSISDVLSSTKIKEDFENKIELPMQVEVSSQENLSLKSCTDANTMDSNTNDAHTIGRQCMGDESEAESNVFSPFMNNDSMFDTNEQKIEKPNIFKIQNDLNTSLGYKIFVEEMIEKYPDASEEEILSLAYIEWNHLRKEDRDTYEDIAKQKMNEALIILNRPNNDKKLNASKPNVKKSFKACTGKFQITGYIIFSSHIRKEIMTNNPHVKFSEVSRLVGEEWQKMGDVEKKSYNEKAKEINVKTLQDAQIEGIDFQIQDTPVPNKDHVRTKRIKTGYAVFAGKMRTKLRDQYPGHKRSDISLIVRDKWKVLESSEKLNYVNQAAAVNIEEAQNLKEDDIDSYKMFTGFEKSSGDSSRKVNCLKINNFISSTPMKEKKSVKKEKAPVTCYQLFCSDVYKRIKDDNPDLTFAEISRKVSCAWKSLPSHHKKEYQEKAAIKNIKAKEAAKMKDIQEETSIICENESMSKSQFSHYLHDDSQASTSCTPFHQTPTLPESMINDESYQHPSVCSSFLMKPPNTVKIEKEDNMQIVPCDEEFESFITDRELKILIRSSAMYKPLSAYQYFFVEMHKKLLKHFPRLSCDEIIRLIDHHWSFLPTMQRRFLESRVDQIQFLLSRFDIPTKIFLGESGDSDDEDYYNLNDSTIHLPEIENSVPDRIELPDLKYNKEESSQSCKWKESRCLEIAVNDALSITTNGVEQNTLSVPDNCSETKESLELNSFHAENKTKSDLNDATLLPNTDSYFSEDEAKSTLDYKSLLLQLFEIECSDSYVNLELAEPFDASVVDDFVCHLMNKETSTTTVENPAVVPQLPEPTLESQNDEDIMNETPESPAADEYFSSPEFYRHLEKMESSLEEDCSQLSNISLGLADTDDQHDKNSRSNFANSNFSTSCLSPPPESNSSVKRIRKTPSKPKTKTIFAYQMFYSEMHPKILAKNPSATPDEISRLIEFEWTRIKKSEKKILKDLAQKNISPINHVHAKHLLHRDSSTGPTMKVMKLPQFTTTFEKTKYLIDSIKSYRVKLRIVAKAFAKLPYDEHSPFYHEMVDNLMDLDTISEKQRTDEYKTVQEMIDDFNLMFNNTFRYSEPESQIYRDALTLKKFILQHYGYLKDQSDDSVRAIDKVQELLFYLFIGVFNFKNNKGRYVTDSFAKLPPYEIVNGQRVRSLSFESIRLGLDRGFYPRLDKFQRDMFNLFERAWKISNPNEELFEDSFTLHRKFINLRDKLCGHGLLLKSQALGFRVKDLTLLLQHSKKSEIKNLPLIDSCGNIYKSLIGTNNIQYQLGDFIYVNPPETNWFFNIIQITMLSSDVFGTKFVYGRKFYRPQEILSSGRTFYSNELYRSNEFINLSMTKVIGKCLIQSLSIFNQVIVRNLSLEDVFVCRSNYDSSSQQFSFLSSFELEELSTLPSYVSSIVRPKAVHMELFGSTEELRIKKRQKVLNELENDLKEALRFKLPNMVQREENSRQSVSYVQYNTPGGIIRLGNFVFIQGSDDDLTSVLQINQIVITKEGSELISGPKFSYSEKAQQLIKDRIPYKNEIFLLSLKETHPISHIVRRCCVLDVTDYNNLRPSEVPEKDVLVCCYLFDEAKQSIQPLTNGLPKCKMPLHLPVEETYFIQRTPPPIPMDEDSSRSYLSPPLPTLYKESLTNKKTSPSFANHFKQELETTKGDKKMKSPSKFIFQKRYILQGSNNDLQSKAKKAKLLSPKETTKLNTDVTSQQVHKSEPKEEAVKEKVKNNLVRKLMKRKRVVSPLSLTENNEVIPKVESEPVVKKEKEPNYDAWEEALVKFVRRQHHLMDPLASIEFYRKAKRLHAKFDIKEPVMQAIHTFKIEHCEEFPTTIVDKKRGRSSGSSEEVKAKNENNTSEDCVDNPLLKEFEISASEVVVKRLKLSRKERKSLKAKKAKCGRPPKLSNSVSPEKSPKKKPGRKPTKKPRDNQPKTKLIAKKRRCIKCHEVFASKAAFLQHTRLMHVKNKCPECGIVLKRSSHFRSHVLWHARIKRCPSCPECQRTFNKADNLEKHLRLEHELEDAEIESILSSLSMNDSNGFEDDIISPCGEVVPQDEQNGTIDSLGGNVTSNGDKIDSIGDQSLMDDEINYVTNNSEVPTENEASNEPILIASDRSVSDIDEVSPNHKIESDSNEKSLLFPPTELVYVEDQSSQDGAVVENSEPLTELDEDQPIVEEVLDPLSL